MEKPEPRATLQAIARSFWESVLALIMPVVVLAVIIGGYATPTAASVVAVVYSLVLGVFIYREINLRQLFEIFSDAAVTSATVMVTVAAAQLFGWITIAEGLGNILFAWLTGLSRDPNVILLVINVVLLILGMIMEPIPIMLLTVPILFPVATQLGIDPVHFGIVVTLNLMIGSITPPIGLNLFVVSAISGASVMAIARASVGFIVILIGVLLLITYVPQMVLWLPHLIYGGG